MLCLDCNYRWVGEFRNIRKGGCPKCHKNTSYLEHKVRKYIGSQIGEELVVSDDRKQIRNPSTGIPLELDIWIPSLKLAFEVNGTKWHDEDAYLSHPKDECHDPLTCDCREHKKTLLCEEKGICLIHLWGRRINDSWDDIKDTINKELSERGIQENGHR